jgi:hypothetical protein
MSSASVQRRKRPRMDAEARRGSNPKSEFRVPESNPNSEFRNPNGSRFSCLVAHLPGRVAKPSFITHALRGANALITR